MTGRYAYTVLLDCGEAEPHAATVTASRRPGDIPTGWCPLCNWSADVIEIHPRQKHEWGLPHVP